MMTMLRLFPVGLAGSAMWYEATLMHPVGLLERVYAALTLIAAIHLAYGYYVQKAARAIK